MRRLSHIRGNGLNRGVAHYRCRLKEYQVRTIRDIHGRGVLGYRPIAGMFGVKWETVRNIVTGRSWGWLK